MRLLPASSLLLRWYQSIVKRHQSKLEVGFPIFRTLQKSVFLAKKNKKSKHYHVIVDLTWFRALLHNFLDSCILGAAAKVLKGQLGEISILVVVPVEEYDKEKMAYLQMVENTKELVVNFPIRNELEVNTVFESHPKCLNLYLVTLFDCKIQVFKNSPKWTFLINFCLLKM